MCVCVCRLDSMEIDLKDLLKIKHLSLSLRVRVCVCVGACVCVRACVLCARGDAVQ